MSRSPEALDDVYYAFQDGDPLVVAADGGLLFNDADPDGGALMVEDADMVFLSRKCSGGTTGCV